MSSSPNFDLNILGEIESMRKEVEPVQVGHSDEEIGILVVRPPDGLKYLPNDRVICYQLKQVQQYINWFPPGF